MNIQSWSELTRAAGPFFLELLNRSASAVWLVVAVVVLRLVLKRAPKWVRCALWALVAVRLLCPVSAPSPLSAYQLSGVEVGESGQVEYFHGAGSMEEPSVAFEMPELPFAGEGVSHPAENTLPAEEPPASPAASRSHSLSLPPLVSLWLAGVGAMLLYALISWLSVRRRVREAVRLQENVWVSDGIGSPFILGLFRPRIYLPAALPEEQTPQVLAHENAHLRRRDHWWKPLGFALLAVHWFNPALWLAYVLLCRDIELACDEKVVREFGPEEKQAYARALLSCSVPRLSLAVCPLAFGEVGIKERIRAVVNYRKPAFWAVAAAAVLCIVAAVCLLTDPPKKGPAFAVVSCPEPTGGESGILLTMYEMDGNRNAERTWKWTYRFEGLTPREVDRYAVPARFEEDKSLWMTYDLDGDWDNCVIGRCITLQEEWDFFRDKVFSLAYEPDESAALHFKQARFILRQGKEAQNSTSFGAKDGETAYIDDEVCTYGILPDGTVTRFDADGSRYRATAALAAEDVAYAYLLYSAYLGAQPGLYLGYYASWAEPLAAVVERDGQRTEVTGEQLDALLQLLLDEEQLSGANPYPLALRCRTVLFDPEPYPSPEVLRFWCVESSRLDEELSPYLIFSLREDGHIIRERPLPGGMIDYGYLWSVGGQLRCVSEETYPVDDLLALVQAGEARRVVDIVDRSQAEGAFVSPLEEPIWETEWEQFSFPNIVSGYVYAVLADGSQVPIREALEQGLVSIDELVERGMVRVRAKFTIDDNYYGSEGEHFRFSYVAGLDNDRLCAYYCGVFARLGAFSRYAQDELRRRYEEDADAVTSAIETWSRQHPGPAEVLRKYLYGALEGPMQRGLAHETFSYAESFGPAGGGGGKVEEPSAVRHYYDAAERAKKECTVPYDVYDCAYDADADLWLVHFFPNDAGAGGLYVVLDSSGTIRMTRADG